MTHASRVSVLFAIAALLASCQDSVSGPPIIRADPLAPIAAAGADITTFKGAPVTLDGAASWTPTYGLLTYRWVQTAGPAVVLSNDRAAMPSFLAPRAVGSLRFALTVSSGDRTSTPDEVVVTVQNRAPIADAGPSRVVTMGSVVTLDASASSDPDGDPLTDTSWYQRSGPPVAVTTHPGGSVSFVAPSTASVVDFGLLVSDGERWSAEDVVRVNVVDEFANWPPTANAGSDRQVPRRSVVQLSATAQDREGDPITWAWLQIAGPSVALLGSEGPTPAFVAPAVEADLEFQAVVSDDLGTGSDRVVVQVRNQPPAITGLAISPGHPITTDALAAAAIVVDADQDELALTWEWTRNASALPGESGPTLAASLTTRGDVFVVTLRASDGVLATSATSSVTILDAAPVLTISAPDVARWGEPLAFTVVADDPDGDPLGTCVLRAGPSGMALSPSCVGSWTPTLPMFDRTLDVTFEVGVASSTAMTVARTVRVEDPARLYPLRRTGIEIPAWQNGLVAFDGAGDGTSTLLVAGRTGLYELGRDADGYAQRWFYPFPAGAGSLASVEARDVDGDGLPEIFLSALAPWSSTTGMLLKLDGVERREAARAALACADLEAADLDGDGGVDLACLVSAATYSSAQRLVILDAATLAVEWQSADLPLGTSLAVGNVDGDAALEVVTAGGYVFDGFTHAAEWVSGSAFGAAVDTGDLDGDGVEEIVGMDSWSRFRGFSAVLKSPLWEKAVFDNDSILVADVDADGTPEIVIGDGQWGNVTAYRYRPATNDLATVFAIDSQDHGVSAIAVADLDGDGALELAWGTGASSSGEDVFVIAGANPQWTVEWKNVNPSQLDGPFLGAVVARTAPGAAPALVFQVPETDSGYAGARLVRLDPSGAVTVSRQLGTNWSGNGALAAADYDGDGMDEILLATASYYDGYYAAYDFAADAAVWTSPIGASDGRVVVAADLNGDGVPDLVALDWDGRVQAYDVLHSCLLFTSTSLGTGVDLAVADLDLDGTPEIVALASNRLVTLRKAASGSVPWLEAASAPLLDAADLEVADCDGDGLPEIYVLSGWSTMTVQRYDGALAQKGSFGVRGTAISLFVEDLGLPRKNLVLGKGERWSTSGTPALLEAVDPVSGKRIWESPPLLGTVPPNSLRYVDLDGDGIRAIAFGTSSGMHLTR